MAIGTTLCLVAISSLRRVDCAADETRDTDADDVPDVYQRTGER